MQLIKLSADVFSINSRNILVRAPNVTMNKTRKPVSSFCPKENRNNMTHAGNGIFLHNEAKKRMIIGSTNPRFDIFAESRAKMREKKVAKTVLLTAMRMERK